MITSTSSQLFRHRIFVIAAIPVLVALWLAPVDSAIGQGIAHQPPETAQAGETISLVFELTDPELPAGAEARLLYKYDHHENFNMLPVEVQDNTVTAELEPDQTASGELVYYVTIEDDDGRVTYPETEPEDSPVTLSIREDRTVRFEIGGETRQLEYNILSPEPNSTLQSDDVIVALALFYGGEEPLPGSFKVYFGSEDVTDLAEISPHLITYTPWAFDRQSGWDWIYPIEIHYVHENGEEERIVNWRFTSRYQ